MAWWRAYPRKDGKFAALKAWKKLSPDKVLLDAMVQKVAEFKRSDGWRKDGGKFVPMAPTWLNQRRW